MIACYDCDGGNKVYIDFSKVKMINAKPGLVEVWFDGEHTPYRFEANGSFEHIVRTADKWQRVRFEQVRADAKAAGVE